MGLQKKHGKGRLDKWYKLAKEKGYRARAAFKLIQLNKKYGFLERSKVLLDLCAAPGVAAEIMPVNSLIVGVDLSPIKPIPRVYTFQGDITTDSCRATIRQHLKTWKADTVLHDGAPNVGTAWSQDSFNQAELALQAMKLATDFLIEGGTFVTKVFRSKDYNPLLWVLNQLFSKVEATKPPSSRNVSAEIFVVCKGYKAPKRIDPRFLDPKSVFAELVGATANNEAKVYNPEKKKRKREGYEEGDYTQFKEIPADQFISASDPIAILGNYSKLSLEASSENLALAALHRLPETTPDIRTCCADLKVLGRRDFKMLLRWRLRVREIFGLSTKKTSEEAKAEEVVEVEPMDEELRIQEDLQAMQEKASSVKKREKRKENERKQKEIVRMQLNMTAPMDIGLEESRPGAAGMFSLKAIDKTDAARRISRGKMVLASEHGRKKVNQAEVAGTESLVGEESDAEADGLERELDSMYEDYRERKLEADAKYRAKKAREGHENDDEWQGLSASEELAGNESSDLEEEDDDASENEGGEPSGGLIRHFDGSDAKINGLSKRATIFFGQDIFKEFVDLLPQTDQVPTGMVMNGHDHNAEQLTRAAKCDSKSSKPASRLATDKKAIQIDEPFETVQHEQHVKGKGEAQKSSKTREADIDIITAEAMTLAHQLATGQKTSHEVVDESYNRYSFRDLDGLPEWFLDDESKHDKPLKPITRDAARAIQEKLRALNARPIKKVREAKARKKIKAAQRLEKLRKKSDMLANDEGMTEKEKAESITRLLRKATGKKPTQAAKLVVAKGLNRGIQGRPRGVKGRYRMVDPRMKKELRAQKRIAQRRKR